MAKKSQSQRQSQVVHVHVHKQSKSKRSKKKKRKKKKKKKVTQFNVASRLSNFNPFVTRPTKELIHAREEVIKSAQAIAKENDHKEKQIEKRKQLKLENRNQLLIQDRATQVDNLRHMTRSRDDLARSRDDLQRILNNAQVDSPTLPPRQLSFNKPGLPQPENELSPPPNLQDLENEVNQAKNNLDVQFTTLQRRVEPPPGVLRGLASPANAVTQNRQTARVGQKPDYYVPNP